MAFDLKPTQAAAEALTDRWRWLRGAAIAFHPQRPCLGLKRDRPPVPLLRRVCGHAPRLSLPRGFGCPRSPRGTWCCSCGRLQRAGRRFARLLRLLHIDVQDKERILKLVRYHHPPLTGGVSSPSMPCRIWPAVVVPSRHAACLSGSPRPRNPLPSGRGGRGKIPGHQDK
jgi:hypothetical protein